MIRRIDERMPVARGIMRRPVRQVLLTTSVREATRFLLQEDISGVLVRDEGGRPAGVFTLKDVAMYVGSRLEDLPEIQPRREHVRETGEEVPVGKGFHFHIFEDTMVRELMTPGVITVAPDAPLAEVARIMTRWKVHRVFVEDRGEIVGVITTMDVLRWIGRTARRATA